MLYFDYKIGCGFFRRLPLFAAQPAEYARHIGGCGAFFMGRRKLAEVFMKKRTFFTELAYILGLIVLAFSAALMEASDLGVSMIVAPA